VGDAYKELASDDDSINAKKPPAKQLTSSVLHGTRNSSITSPHDLAIEPTQLSFSTGKHIEPKKRCLACRKLGYTSCQCHLVAQNVPLLGPNDVSNFIPDDKGISIKPKRKYTRKSDKSKTQVDKPKRKYTKKVQKKTITHEQPKNQITINNNKT
jgi:hypothetical protein